MNYFAVMTIYFTKLLLVLVTPTLGSLNGITSLFEYQTTQLLEGKDEGIVAAFGDFNADELGDIFLITNNSKQVSILLAQENKPYLRKTILNITTPDVISGIVPADFNGDVQMDVLLVTREPSAKEGPYHVNIYWGNRTTSSLNPVPYHIDAEFRDEPLVFDFNADMLPDLLMEPFDKAGDRKVWISHRNKSFVQIDFPKMEPNKTASPFTKPQSHAFVDLNNDLAADVLLTTVDGYEMWMNNDGEFVHNTTRPYPSGLKNGFIGLSTFGDLDLDQHLDQIVPGCLDKKCTQSAIFVYDISTNEWQQRMSPESFQMNGETWNFFTNEESEYKDIMNQSFPLALRLGDYNLDGYIDAVAVLKSTTAKGENSQRVFLFDNLKCGDSDNCPSYNRTFKLHDSGQFAPINKGVMLGTLYDIYEDGVPDIVMVVMSNNNNKNTPKIVLMKNDFAINSCFFKVTVVSGLCGDGCSEIANPYGVNYPGPTITYATTTTEGKRAESTGTQLTQTSHFALQTPYQTFGLGDTPNFVETMTVGIPDPEGEGLRQKSWPFIIPNSQLVVIPHPPNNPKRWKLKLYVTPSQLIYFTGIALLGTCAFVAVIVGILHWREKREDKLEKKQEAQKFHFDAM